MRGRGGEGEKGRGGEGDFRNDIVIVRCPNGTSQLHIFSSCGHICRGLYPVRGRVLHGLPLSPSLPLPLSLRSKSLGDSHENLGTKCWIE